MKAVLCSFIILFLTAANANCLWAAEIAVLMSSDAAIYQEALQGFREAVPNRSVKVQLLTNRLEERADQLKIIGSVVEPDIIFVIGTSALQAVAGKFTDIPIVHSMVFSPQAGVNADGKNITGIGMIPAPARVMSLIQELNTQIRRVGVMYDPTRSNAMFEQAQSAAQKENLKLVAREIRSPGDIGPALRNLQNEIDLLWLWPDERFLAEEILQRVFLFSFENKIPVLGLSERHTQMGALVSLSHGGAKDMGKQAGELVNKMLGKTGPPPAGPVVPRQVKLTVNLKTAGKLDIEVPDSIIRRAVNAVNAPVYKEGDWWVFQLKRIYLDRRVAVEHHRISFHNGKFESDYLWFLHGEDSASPYFLPFPTVHLNDPWRRPLSFPLLPGKKWSFRYQYYHLRIGGGDHNNARASADAEVIGHVSHPVETEAGKFDAIEIQRIDYLRRPATVSYFYSPQTKSVVKAIAELHINDPGFSGRRFELELIAYGTAEIEKRPAR